MSMIGSFLRTDLVTFEKIKAGELNVWQLDEQLIDSEFTLDIDKSWQIIHYVLTGKEEGGKGILAKMVIGLNYINEEDGGYGPAMQVSVDEIKKINKAIAKIDDKWFKKRLDIEKLIRNDIYPVAGASNDDNDELFEYCWSHFCNLREFYKSAEKANQTILFYLS